MSENFYQRLLRGNSGNDYGFQGSSSQQSGPGRFSTRHLSSPKATTTNKTPARRNDDADRQPAYVPVKKEPAVVSTWRPPTLGEILKDLGLRMIEVAIGAAAQEVAYFFTKRRFIPKHYYER